MPQHVPLPERFTAHRRLVATITDAGVTPPTRWTELNDRLNDFLALENTAAHRLADAVVEPKRNTDLAMLRVMALAEESAGPERVARIHRVVVGAVEEQMNAAYSDAAMDVYRTVAAQFDAAADGFTAAATACDPEAPATDLVSAPEDQRQAWLTAELDAVRLDAALPVLIAATQLANTRIEAPTRLAPGWWRAQPADAALIALCVDTSGLHRRRIWEAWQHTGGRTKRWGALVALGARIRAHSLDTFEFYREPRPLIYRQEQGAERGTVRNVVLDPEDDDYQAPEQPFAYAGQGHTFTG